MISAVLVVLHELILNSVTWKTVLVVYKRLRPAVDSKYIYSLVNREALFALFSIYRIVQGFKMFNIYDILYGSQAFYVSGIRQ